MSNATVSAGFTPETLDQIRSGDGRPVLFTNATVRTLDPLIGDVVGDVLLGGARIVGVGPGIVTAAGDDGAIVVDCTGLAIVPAAVDVLAIHGNRRSRGQRVGTLTPGNAADLAVLPRELANDAIQAADTLLNTPERVTALVSGGEVVRWAGDDLDVDVEPTTTGAQDLSASPHLGEWIDESGFLHQTLTADGRYDETRGGRPHAFQGSFWIDGDRIDYLDDLGFWAFGTFEGDDTLLHAGYVLHRG